jgi:hypothetical protein
MGDILAKRGENPKFACIRRSFSGEFVAHWRSARVFAE